MAKDNGDATADAELRCRAEELLRAKRAEVRPPRTEAELQRLSHELEVHRIELEMQNAELRKSRDEMEATLEMYTDLYDFAPVGYFSLDRDGVIRAANLTGAAILRVERSLLPGRRFDSFLSPEMRLNFIPFLERVFTGRVKETWEAPLKNDGKRPLHLQIEAVASASDTECRLAVIDISDRSEAEDRLRKSERRLAEAQMLAHIGSWEWDSIADEITGSEEFKRIFGQGLSTYDSFMELVHADDRETVNRAVRETLAHQAPYNVHYRIIRPDGITRVIHAQAMAIIDSAGSTVRMIGTAQDVTERREMEEKLEIMHSEVAAHASELEAANIELEAFNYMVAHDLRSPLSSINGYCQVLQKLFAGQNEDCTKYLREIYGASLRMDRLIDALLVFSRVTRVKIHHEKVALGKIALEAAMGLKMSEPERRVAFRISEGIVANGDASLLRIVIDNLIGNAWKYSAKREESVIEFGVSETEREQTYFVRDNGAGFDNAYAEKLFVPFQRLPGSKEFKGHGIGLATVDRIIRRHGGRVWAEGELGKGATFHFTLAADRDSSRA
jgi:PAS domain S-box-containing protein